MVTPLHPVPQVFGGIDQLLPDPRIPRIHVSQVHQDGDDRIGEKLGAGLAVIPVPEAVGPGESLKLPAHGGRYLRVAGEKVFRQQGSPPPEPGFAGGLRDAAGSDPLAPGAEFLTQLELRLDPRWRQLPRRGLPRGREQDQAPENRCRLHRQ